MSKRHCKQRAREIRQATGIPLAAANALAVMLFVSYEKYNVTSNPAVNRWAALVDMIGCECCGPSWKVVVTGPKGKWEYE